VRLSLLGRLEAREEISRAASVALPRPRSAHYVYLTAPVTLFASEH
jgi:hypothetical protein